MEFSNHFSKQAKAYKEFRPTYPQALFDFLATTPSKRDLAWDCATGNGQAAVSLASYFERVIASDGSKQQIANAKAHPRVEYRVALAERSDLSSGSVDLVTVAQALHWFRFNEFYEEVRRVGSADSVIAVWAYPLMQSANKQVNEILGDFYWNIVGPYWPPERAHLDNDYADIPFPFEPLKTPRFEIKAVWNLERFLNYLGTWSAVQKYKEKNSTDPVESLTKRITPAWGEANTELEFSTDLIIKVGRIHARAA